MTKTNFKCMFLIDDKLYKKAILKDDISDTTSLKTVIPNSIYLNPVHTSQHQLTSESESMKQNLEKELNTMKTSEESRPLPESEIEDIDQKLSTSDTVSSESSQNEVSMDISQNEAKDEDCECYEQPPPASVKRARERKKVVKHRRGFESPTRKKEFKKIQKIKAVGKQPGRKTISVTEEMDEDLSEESDWEELRERYRRLRGDYDSPPRKKDYMKTKAEKKYVNELSVLKKKEPLLSLSEQNNRKKSKNDIRAKKEIKMVAARKRKSDQDTSSMKTPRREFLCKLCQSYYKTKSSLQRHNINIHGEQRGSKRSKSVGEDRYIKRQKNNNNIAVSYQNYF